MQVSAFAFATHAMIRRGPAETIFMAGEPRTGHRRISKLAVHEPCMHVVLDNALFGPPAANLPSYHFTRAEDKSKTRRIAGFGLH